MSFVYIHLLVYSELKEFWHRTAKRLIYFYFCLKKVSLPQKMLGKLFCLTNICAWLKYVTWFFGVSPQLQRGNIPTASGMFCGSWSERRAWALCTKASTLSCFELSLLMQWVHFSLFSVQNSEFCVWHQAAWKAPILSLCLVDHFYLNVLFWSNKMNTNQAFHFLRRLFYNQPAAKKKSFLAYIMSSF